MNLTDETLAAYADGELDEATRASIEAHMRADPEIAGRVAAHQALRMRVSAAFNPVLAEPVPERLAALTRASSTGAGQVIELRPKRPAARQWSWTQWGAMAASFILGAIVLRLALHDFGGAPVSVRDGRLVASGVLASALSQQLASAPPTNAEVQIGVSFRSRASQYCRAFVLEESSPLAGVACRAGSDWQLKVLAPAALAAGSGAYRQAASALPAAVRAEIDAQIAGEPLDANAERVARDRNWK
jgi:hypothetical protein